MAEKEKTAEGIDLFKVILVVCGLACVVFLVLNVIQYGNLNHAREGYGEEMKSLSRLRATADAISQLKQKRELFKADMDLRPYIEGNVQEGAAIGTDAFKIEGERPKVNSKQGYQDQPMQITFHRQGEGARRKQNLPLSRSQIFAVLYNLESQSPQVKVSEVEMEAVETYGRSSAGKSDPDKLSDQWILRKLEVLKRSPAKIRKRK